MGRIVAALALVLTLAASATADHRQVPYEEIVRWAGCEAALVTSDEHSVLASYYNWDVDILYIGTQEVDGLSQELAEMVLFHEIGHCLQDQNGLLGTGLPAIVTELDADRWSADLACGLGRDGRRLLHDILVWAKQTYGYDGDPDHGTLAQRIAQGSNASMCVFRHPEAPVLRRI